MIEKTMPKFQEEFSAKIPALALLMNLGWTFLSPEEALIARGGKQTEVVLREVLRQELKKRRFAFAGRDYPLSDKAIDNLITEVCSPALNKGLLQANEALYNHFLYGISVTEFIEGKKASPTIALIDWQRPENNSFIFTEEFSVTRAGGVDARRPDIVCFVNGIPWVVIEAKRPDGHVAKPNTCEEAISQHLRNQRHDEIPRLFAYSQLLLSINGQEAKYGTCGTDATFWSVWHEEDILEAEMFALKNKKLSEEQSSALFQYRSKDSLSWYQQLIAGGELALTGQDRLLIALLRPDRLLEMTRFFILFDKKKG